MRRAAGVLLPLEIEVLGVAVEARRVGAGWVHGFAVAKRVRDASGARRLTSHGTLYKALGRLAEGGLLESRWEDAATALAEGRPRRRLYRITELGAEALAFAVEGPGRIGAGETRVAPA
jgi:DNA-binding PadR family transcriptional regulator